MQSARQHVLKILDRTHTPGRPEACVAEARAAGFEHVNLDLIYGTPGETDDDWRASLDAALGAGPDHVSAYALIVEEGTQLARRIRRGEVPMTDDDVHADRYLIADERLAAAGFTWYEVSNWATTDAARCRHNELYWTGADWWGAGPGAHSHVGGVRWWNVKHPGAYAQALDRGPLPGRGPRDPLRRGPPRRTHPAGAAAGSDGCPLDILAPGGARAAARALADGLLEAGAVRGGPGRTDTPRAAAGGRGGAGSGGLRTCTRTSEPMRTRLPHLPTLSLGCRQSTRREVEGHGDDRCG